MDILRNSRLTSRPQATKVLLETLKDKTGIVVLVAPSWEG
jgi:hypothetical protein